MDLFNKIFYGPKKKKIVKISLFSHRQILKAWMESPKERRKRANKNDSTEYILKSSEKPNSTSTDDKSLSAKIHNNNLEMKKFAGYDRSTSKKAVFAARLKRAIEDISSKKTCFVREAMMLTQ